MGANARGHRVVPHTADVILEAWANDVASCCEEAVAALTGVYAEVVDARELERRRVHLGPGPADDLLLDLLEEVIFTLDTAEGVPVRAEIRAGDDGGLDVELVLAERASVTAAGAVPKAVSRSDLTMRVEAGGAHCRFLVDV